MKPNTFSAEPGMASTIIPESRSPSRNSVHLRPEYAVRAASLVHVFGEQRIQMEIDAITEVVTDGAHLVEPGDQWASFGGWQLGGGIQDLFEHANQRVEVGVLLITDVIGESGGAFAVEDQEFGKSGGVPTALL
jgi:hypothetical protein